MKIRSNRLEDLIAYLKKNLDPIYDERESMNLVYMLLSFYLGMNRAEIVLQKDMRLPESTLLRLHFAMKELRKGRPIQYVTGISHFMGMDIIVNENVLIPRQETEELVNWALNHIPLSTKMICLDMASGSGCIGLALKKWRPDSLVFACDVSEYAIETGRLNAQKLSLDVSFFRCDVLGNPKWEFNEIPDIIISNPPYVLPSQKSVMEDNVLNYEPHQALFVPEEDPLVFYRNIIEYAIANFKTKVQCFFEINELMGAEMMRLACGYGFQAEVKKDIHDKDRMLRIF